MANRGKTGGTLETKWSVRDIQHAVVSYVRSDDCVPNVSFGFFQGMECDLVRVSDSDRLHEFEIKRSWGDFMADFRKRRFHDDVRICRLTFVLPESFAGDRLKKFCAENYQTFKREFDFLFYVEGGVTCGIAPVNWVPTGSYSGRLMPEERFRTETYITPEMLKVIRKNDVAAPYRRRLFLEELVKLYRLGVIRLWHRGDPDELDEQAKALKTDRDEMFAALIRIGNWCAQDLAENTFVSEGSGNYLKTLNGLCEICRPFMQRAAKLKEYGGTEDGD